jgi:prepilin-type N-terminal cleavage/methylation domain-containing protein
VNQRFKKSGFTLIELLAVIAIIAILAAIIVPKIADATGKAKRTACSSNMKTIVRAMQLYEEDRGVSAVATNAETTLTIFGRLNYIDTSDKDGDRKVGLTTMKVYNCPTSTSIPPTAAAYKLALLIPNPNPANQNIDYGIVITGNTFAYKADPDRNVILAEIALNHSKGRNVAHLDSSVTFLPKLTTLALTQASYPKNSDSTGAVVAGNIYDASQILGPSGVIAGLTVE